jgi:hypothetical protein
MMDGGAASMHPAPLASFLFFAVLLAPPPAAALTAPGIRVHLRGTARIDAHAARSQGKLVLSGIVTDDLGGGVPGMRVVVQIATLASDADGSVSGVDRDAHEALLPLAASAPEMCTDVTQAPVLEGVDRMVVPTAMSSSSSASGTGVARFCLRLALPAGRYVAHLDARPTGLVDGARLDLPIDLGLEAVTLRFAPEIPVRSLDDAIVPVDVVASTEDDGITQAAAALPLVLSNESGSSLGSAATDAAGRARFLVSGALLGPAGRGELRVGFGGNARIGASTYASMIERRTHVVLEFPDAVGGRLPAGSADSVLALRVMVKTSCAARGCVGLSTGTIEVGLGGETGAAVSEASSQSVVGAGSLREGEARVVTTFGARFERGGEAHLRVRYVPGAPGFWPTDASDLVQPLRPPSPWREFGLLAAGIGVVAWLVASRLSIRPASVRSGPEAIPAEERIGRVEVVHSDAPPGTSGGRVLDAHEGAPVAGARLAIERPGFERSTIVVATVSDAAGSFSFGKAEIRPGDQLVAEGPWHGHVRLPMPPGGDLLVTLVARRRALLDRLVAWARRRGRPFDATPEPTPAQIRKAARAVGPDALGAATVNASIHAWADAVERAAYGGEPIDARRESEVDGLAPPDAATGPDSRPR